MFVVNTNNGNVNNNDRDNNAFVRAVRAVPGEFQDAVGLRELHGAWKEARRKKRPSCNQLAFDARWLSGLLELQRELASGAWEPRPSTCFIATRPKAREIHAPDFADRIVHHVVVRRLEPEYERIFIFDSYANRKGKGSHAAVRRLQQFVRQEPRAWSLKLDVHNFFNSIHRQTQYTLLKRRMQRAGTPDVVQRAVHALLRRSPLAAGVTYRGTPEERALVPPHKRLENAPAGCGLPIGNLSSQFFANVYLNELDQFVKHELRAKRYLRYVDDFVLIHPDRGQLERWLVEIERFLGQRLRLSLKPDIRLCPLASGVDFLGYVVYPTHTRARRRVVAHARDALATWERAHVEPRRIRATPADLRRIRSVWRSYEGHLQHANTHRLQAALLRRFAWLPLAIANRRFDRRLEGTPITITRTGH